MSTTIDWPAALRPASVDWGLLVTQRASRSAFDGSTQAQTLGAPRWQFSITTGVIRLAEVPLWEAFTDQLDGMVNRVRAWDWRREVPLGVATGSPSVRVAGAGASVQTEGWTANVSGILLAGSWIGVNGELKRLSVDANSDSLGRATLAFKPALRASLSVGLPLTLVKPKALFVMTTPKPTFTQEGSRAKSVTLEFEEVPA